MASQTAGLTAINADDFPNFIELLGRWPMMQIFPQDQSKWALSYFVHSELRSLEHSHPLESDFYTIYNAVVGSGLFYALPLQTTPGTKNHQADYPRASY